ncbi:MAG: hypothetical protein CM1200mP40_33440 [Gammaproteobacteria bacterium]|nr:MAG: hypothetical protein CM1200mP40_33440 [Gammaproteobacteria bacterium]
MFWAGKDFLVASRFTIADIILLVSLDFAILIVNWSQVIR